VQELRVAGSGQGPQAGPAATGRDNGVKHSTIMPYSYMGMPRG
jgi:hypothetical protein